MISKCKKHLKYYQSKKSYSFLNNPYIAVWIMSRKIDLNFAWI